MHSFTRVLVATLAALAVADRAAAQGPFEAAGERALGMAGAFVAVADDATAVHWNPAGLVAGGPVGLTTGWSQFQFGKDADIPEGGAVWRRTSLTSLGTWPIGLSYGHSQAVTIGEASGSLFARRLRTSQVGVTVLQTVVDGLVIGSTVRYVRGSAQTTMVTAPRLADAFRDAREGDATGRGTLDLDVGILATSERLRVGLTIKNLRAPSFGSVADPATTLQRQARLGVAYLPSDGLTLAMDIALDTVDLTGGLRRTFALGGEGRLTDRWAIRSGLRWSLSGTPHPVLALGSSLRLRSGLWLDGHYALGRANEARELGLALRAGL